MATTPIAPVPTPTKRARKANGMKSTKHSITLTFDDKYSNLYDELVQSASNDDRPVPQYVLRFLNATHKAVAE